MSWSYLFEVNVQQKADFNLPLVLQIYEIRFEQFHRRINIRGAVAEQVCT